MATNNPRISIIMPVFNAGNSVSRMLDSIIAQTYENWELIAIDDGSTDNSAEILDSYSASDCRIRVIHRPNDGVSSARQLGMEMSEGEYLIHADSDDFVEPDMLEALLRVADDTKSDVVFCDYFVDDNYGNIKIISQQPPETAEDILNALFSSLHGSCCNKLVKKSTLEHYNVRFPKGINYCEDLLLWVQLFVNPNITVAYLNRAFYHYYFSTESTSICHSYSKKLFNTQVSVLRKMESILGAEHSELANRYKMSIKRGAFEHPIFTSKEYYSIFPELNKAIFKTDMSMTNRLCMYISYCISYRLGTKLYQLKNKITGH